MKRAVLLVMCSGLVAACGSEPPDLPDAGESLFPVAVGNRWEYRVEDSTGDVTAKVQTITSTRADGFLFQTVRGDRETFSVQRIDAEGRLIRVSEYSTKIGVVVERITFVPYDVRVDVDEIEVGAKYTQTYLEDHDPLDGFPDVEKTQTFTVESIDDPVSVPAGSFRAIRIRRTTAGGPAKTYWFAKGVGKLKEAGGQLEELVSSEVAP